MIVKVNKNQVIDDYELDYIKSCNRMGTTLTTKYPNIYSFEEEDVTKEKLFEYIDKGYGIKINC